MTALDECRIEMAENSDERTLDEMFRWLESAPEGFKVEIGCGPSTRVSA
ncbi:hypothetical protein RKD30_003175 [Streptomyces pristinaespiralis]